VDAFTQPGPVADLSEAGVRASGKFELGMSGEESKACTVTWANEKKLAFASSRGD